MGYALGQSAGSRRPRISSRKGKVAAGPPALAPLSHQPSLAKHRFRSKMMKNFMTLRSLSPKLGLFLKRGRGQQQRGHTHEAGPPRRPLTKFPWPVGIEKIRAVY